MQNLENSKDDSADDQHGRRRVFRTASAVLLVGVLLAWSQTGFAQVNTLGFRVGEKSKLHTNLDIATAFDSNSLRREDIEGTPTDETEGVEDVRLLIRPSIELEVPGRSFEFKFGLGASITQFLGTGSSARDETLFGFDSAINLRVGSKESTVAFYLQNNPVLTPTVLPGLGTIGADERLFPAFTDTGRAYLTVRPGGGALEFDVGYANQFIIYTRDDPGSPDDGFTNTAFVEGRWKFLPKTAALIYADFSSFDPANPSRDTATTLDSNPISVMLGLRGKVTRTLSAELRAGYGETLVWERGGSRFSSVDDANQRTVVGLASLTWQVMQTAQVYLAYQRSVLPTVVLSSMITDAIRLRGNWSIDRLVLGAYGEVQFRDFGTQTEDPTAESEPFATLVFGGARADYYFFDWLMGGLNYRVMLQSSNDEDRAFATPVLGGFDRHQVFAQVGFRY